MYKGAQKKIIVLKSPDSRYFDEAHFIVKESFREDATEESINEMIEEANRILNDSMLYDYFDPSNVKKKQKPNLQFIKFSLWYALGALSCAGAMILSAKLFL